MRPMERDWLRVCRMEWNLLWRAGEGEYRVLFFLLSSLVAIYMAVKVGGVAISGGLWHVLFWLLMLWAVLYSGYRVMRREVWLYTHFLFDKGVLFLARAFRGFLVSVFFGLILWAGMSVLFGNGVRCSFSFLGVVIGACIGMSMVSTGLGFLLSEGESSPFLFVVLAFPLLMPIFLYALMASMFQLRGEAEWSSVIGIWALAGMSGAFIFTLLSWGWKSH